MNRTERRRQARKDKVPVKNVKNLDQPIDPTVQTFCWNHRIVLENPQNPTERDKQLLDSIRFQPFKTTDRNGKLELGRACPKCHNVVMVSEGRALSHAGLEGYTDKTEVEGL